MIFDQIEMPSRQRMRVARPGDLDDEWSCYKRTMGSLSTVCALFRAICQPRIFCDLLFAGKSYTRSGPFVKPGEWAFVVRSPLGSYVKSCKFRDWWETGHQGRAPDPAQIRRYRHTLRANLKAASNFQALTSVQIFKSAFNASVILGLSHLPALVAVSVLDCQTTMDGLRTLKDLGNGHLSTLRIVGTSPRLDYYSSALSTLVDRVNLRCLEVDREASSLIESVFMAGDAASSKLERLSITFPAGQEPQPTFLNALSRERCLIDLTILQQVHVDRDRRGYFKFVVGVELWRGPARQPLACTVTATPNHQQGPKLNYAEMFHSWNPSAPTDLQFCCSMLYWGDLDLLKANTAMRPEIVGWILHLFGRYKVGFLLLFW